MKVLILNWLPLLNLLVIPVIAGVIRLNKTLTVLKFYVRTLCSAADPKIDCGEDLK
jgi:hypothetical protein